MDGIDHISVDPLVRLSPIFQEMEIDMLSLPAELMLDRPSTFATDRMMMAISNSNGPFRNLLAIRENWELESMSPVRQRELTNHACEQVPRESVELNNWDRRGFEILL